jgi:hypothetical protein
MPRYPKDSSMNSILDHLKKLGDWLERLRDKRRIEYQRAKFARPDYGTAEGFEWVLLIDGVLSNALALLRAVHALAIVGVALYLLLSFGLVYVLLTSFR